jgi:hypothetical protein
MTSFARRHLDPPSRLGEILFGLIMVLTITSTAGLTVAEGREGVRQLLFAAVGCNLAWAIIDAIMYLMNCLTVRSEKLQMIRAVQNAPDSQTALTLIQEGVEPELQALLDPAGAAAFSQSTLKYIGEAKIVPVTLTKEDFNGALACFWLVLIACLPAALPFLIFSAPRFALRVSNFLLIVLLFLVGRAWARYVKANQLVAGSVMVAVGLALVGIAVLLGG